MASARLPCTQQKGVYEKAQSSHDTEEIPISSTDEFSHIAHRVMMCYTTNVYQ